MNGAANAFVRATATDVAAHRDVDLIVGRCRCAREQCRGRHDLTRLAIAALRHVFFDPRFLHGMRAIGRQSFDRRHAFAGRIGDRDAAGFHRSAVDVNRARAAFSETAAEFRAGETNRIAQHPEQWHIRRHVNRLTFAVERDVEGHGASLLWKSARIGHTVRPIMMLDGLGTQVAVLLILAMPIACIAWTVTHEEVFRELHQYCVKQSHTCRHIAERKFFYLFTCEYCFSHWVAILVLIVTRYRLLFPDWRGYVIAGFSLVWIANAYMSLFGRLRLEIREERLEIEMDEMEKKNVTREAKRSGSSAGRR